MALHGCEAGWFSLPLEMPTDHECVDLRSPWFTYKPHAFIKPVRPGAQTVCAPVRSKTDVQRRVGSNVFLFVLGEFPLLKSLRKGWHPNSSMPEANMDNLVDNLLLTDSWAIAQINATGTPPHSYNTARIVEP